jgi:beta-glucosidase
VRLGRRGQRHAWPEGHGDRSGRDVPTDPRPPPARAVLRDHGAAAVGWTVAVQAYEPVPGAEDAWRHYSRLWHDRFLEVARDDDWVGLQIYTAEKVGPDGPEGPPAGA